MWWKYRFSRYHKKEMGVPLALLGSATFPPFQLGGLFLRARLFASILRSSATAEDGSLPVRPEAFGGVGRQFALAHPPVHLTRKKRSSKYSAMSVQVCCQLSTVNRQLLLSSTRQLLALNVLPSVNPVFLRISQKMPIRWMVRKYLSRTRRARIGLQIRNLFTQGVRNV